MNNDVAVFLDLDNVVIGATEVNLTFDVNLLLTHIKRVTKGRVVLRYAYGDWRQHEQVPRALATAGFELQATVRLGHMSKNLVDMQMVVDAMETLVDGHDFSTYVLVTGDRDFVPLVSALRKRGKQVIGMGLRHTTSHSLVDLCDHYYYYDDLVKTQQQERADKVSQWLETAVEALLQDRDQIPASMLKERMRLISEGQLDKIPEARDSFRKLLAQYPKLVRLELDGTTLYAMRPQTTPTIPSATQPVQAEPPISSEKSLPKLTESEAHDLLKNVMDELAQGKKHVRASLIKERLQALRHNQFDEADLDVPNFRAFLEKFPDLIRLELQGTTLFVSQASDDEETIAELHLRYRHALKKRGLRVVPPNIRLQILKDVIALLQNKGQMLWKTIVDNVVDNYRENESLTISKGHIHDTLRVARRSEVITTSNGSKALMADPLQLHLQGNKPFQDAVMRCDATYLRELQEAFGSVDLNEAALALYDSKGYERYLKVVLNHY